MFIILYDRNNKLFKHSIQKFIVFETFILVQISLQVKHYIFVIILAATLVYGC